MCHRNRLLLVRSFYPIQKKIVSVLRMSEKDDIFKQYELMVNSAQQVTTWRQTTNGFYITFNTAILALLSGILGTPDVSHSLLGVVGVAVSFFWYMHIDYFAKLNKAKFRVIGKMEDELTFKMYQDEQEYFNQEQCKNATWIEKCLVCVFILLYAYVFLSAVTGLF